MYRIIQLSDCHLYADLNKVGYGGINPYESLQALLSIVQKKRPDMLVLTGDLSNDNTEQSYQHLLDLLSPILNASDIQVRAIPGNHDQTEFLYQCFACPPEYEDIQGWRLHYLNSQHEGTLGYVSAARLQRLKNDIVNSPRQQQLVFVHHHPINTNSWLDKHEWLNREDFLQVLNYLTMPVKVLHGHIHAERETEYLAHSVYACPSTCWQWQLTPEFGINTLRSGFRVVELGANTYWHSYVERLPQSTIIKKQ